MSINCTPNFCASPNNDFTTPDIFANASSNKSTPFSVVANAAISEPNNTTNAPIPVEIKANLSTFIAADNPPVDIIDNLVAPSAAFCPVM